MFLTSRNAQKIRDVSREKKKMQPMQVMQEGRFPVHHWGEPENVVSNRKLTRMLYWSNCPDLPRRSQSVRPTIHLLVLSIVTVTTESVKTMFLEIPENSVHINRGDVKLVRHTGIF
jgi:hypothetical protein